MGSLSSKFALMCVAVCLGLGTLTFSGGSSDDARIVKSLDATTDPVAIISPLPEMISNGTQYTLNGSASYDPNAGYLTNHTWIITHGDQTWYLWGEEDTFRFRDEGLYKITLIVEDLWGNTDDAFTAVLSVEDSDFDGMPDWWEIAYFASLDEEPTDDFDGDGYTNLQEYADGTNPIVVDPPPASPGLLEENWMFVVAAAAVIVVVLLALYPRIRKRRKDIETKKIEYAIEIEKTLEEE